MNLLAVAVAFAMIAWAGSLATSAITITYQARTLRTRTPGGKTKLANKMIKTVNQIIVVAVVLLLLAVVILAYPYLPKP